VPESNDPVTPGGRGPSERRRTPGEPEVKAVLTGTMVLPPATSADVFGSRKTLKSSASVRVCWQSPVFCEYICCTVYAVAAPAMEPVTWLHMSPFSPFWLSYQASGGANVDASPTSGSLIASPISCEAAEQTFWKAVPWPQPRSQPEPGPKSGTTP